MIDSYITVKDFGYDELTIKKSRFIGYAAPCATEEEAQQFIRQIREKHRDAKHHCYAYIIGLNSSIMRYSDDGEPGGTAGLPMMDLIRKEKAVNCCVVVVRYFGGILLGTGGLARAYMQGCKIALDAAGLVTMEQTCILRCTVSYSLWNSIQYSLQKMRVRIDSTEYRDSVSFVLFVRKNDCDETIQNLLNITEAKISYKISGEKYAEWELNQS